MFSSVNPIFIQETGADAGAPQKSTHRLRSIPMDGVVLLLRPGDDVRSPALSSKEAALSFARAVMGQHCEGEKGRPLHTVPVGGATVGRGDDVEDAAFALGNEALS